MPTLAELHREQTALNERYRVAYREELERWARATFADYPGLTEICLSTDWESDDQGGLYPYINAFYDDDDADSNSPHDYLESDPRGFEELYANARFRRADYADVKNVKPLPLP